VNWNITFHEKRQMVVVRKWGNFSSADQERCFEAIVTAPFWRPGLPILSDITHLHMETVDLNGAEDNRGLFQRMHDQLGKSNWAMVCKTDLQFGLARQLELMCDISVETEISAFRSEKEAVDWLTS
jgi:hypothetical protein